FIHCVNFDSCRVYKSRLTPNKPNPIQFARFFRKDFIPRINLPAKPEKDNSEPAAGNRRFGN
ncbi:MAG TPA: hypothetical protein VGB00_05200, partial [Pyrinomonadaceae bacterium]